jgi:Zn-dependent M28 family amino/carboxypeptidase
LDRKNNVQVSFLIEQKSLFDHLHYLSDDNLLGRKVGSEGNRAAQRYIIKTLTNMEIKSFNDEYRHSFYIKKSLETISANNVIAIIPGKSVPEKYIVLSAHFDHIGFKRTKIFNGADDNASGTSALLSIGEQLSKNPLNHSVILLFTNSEESHLKGAKAFVRDHADIMKQVKLNVNLDMLAGSKSTTRLNYISRGLENIISDENLSRFKFQNYSFKIDIHQGFKRKRFRTNHNINWKMASDHGAFYQAKIPFIYFGVGTHINYHKTTDTYENVNLPLFYHATNAIYHQVMFLDQHMEHSI